MVFLIWPFCFHVTIIPDFDFGVSTSREGLIETNAQSSRQNVMWHDMVMSEHVFYAPERLTTGSGLANIKGRFSGPSMFQDGKTEKVSSVDLFSWFFGSSGGSDDTKIE